MGVPALLNIKRFPLARLIALALFLAAGTPAHADANANRLTEFFAGQGCAIGPSTRRAAIAAGFDGADIDDLERTARADEGAVETGDWVVLSPSRCKIQMPAITSKIKLTDGDMKRYVSAPDAYLKDGEPGCFLNGDQLQADMQLSHGWDQDIVLLEYTRFLAAGFAAGQLTFFSSDTLKTPMGVQVITGACAEVPNIEAIRENHDLLSRHFDALIRAQAANIVYDDKYASFNINYVEVEERITGRKIANAWSWFELDIIARGAGWYEGMGGAVRGTPRPPLCHFK